MRSHDPRNDDPRGQEGRGFGRGHHPSRGSGIGRQSMRSLRYVVPVLLFLVVAGFLLLGLNRNPGEIPSPLIGKPAPAWALPRLASTEAPVDAAAAPALDAAALRGAPYLLNVWAS